MIGGSGQRMIRMIDLWQGIYALETGEYSLDPRDVDLALVARNIREELADILSSLDVELVITVHGRPAAGDDSFMVRGEELLLYSMLANLVKNAVEASPRGQRVDLDFRRAAAAWEAVIHNQGAIAQEIRPVFFDKYATCGKKHGLGLGAYSARLMATAHGGDIAFTTDEASGTTLTVRIPRDPPVKPA
jgi:signal transduction histidine kinase